MIRPSSHMQVSEAVLYALKALCPDELDAAYEAYSNGREQGYHIVGPNSRRVSFSEYRNTDDIVIYWGLAGDFDMSGNIANDKVYRMQQKGFMYGKFTEAAEFIICYLQDGKI